MNAQKSKSEFINENKEKTQKLIKGILGEVGPIVITPDWITIYPPENRYNGEWEVTFKMLTRLASWFRTAKINLSFKKGWGGSDLTPGDPSQICIYISLE